MRYRLSAAILLLAGGCGDGGRHDRAVGNLRDLGMVMFEFARDIENGMRFPAELDQLKPYVRTGDLERIAFDPYSGGRIQWLVAHKETWKSTRLGPKVSDYAVPGYTPVAACAPRADGGRVVLMADGTVAILKPEAFDKACRMIP
jgi:hypothetical protein